MSEGLNERMSDYFDVQMMIVYYPAVQPFTYSTTHSFTH